MNKWLAMVLLVACVAGLVRCDPISGLAQLNEDLHEKLTGGENLESSLALIRQEIEKLGPDRKEAGQLILDLVDHSRKECDAKLLNVMMDLIKTGIFSSDQPELTTVRHLTEQAWSEAQKVCNEFMERSYRRADQDMTWFLASFQKQWDLSSPLMTTREVASRLSFVAVGDERASCRRYDEKLRKLVPVRNQRVFDMVLKEYLVEPCKRLVSREELPNHLLSQTLAIKRKGNSFFLERLKAPRPVNLDLALGEISWAKEACLRTILRMDDKFKRDVMMWT